MKKLIEIRDSLSLNAALAATNSITLQKNDKKVSNPHGLNAALAATNSITTLYKDMLATRMRSQCHSRSN